MKNQPGSQSFTRIYFAVRSQSSNKRFEVTVPRGAIPEKIRAVLFDWDGTLVDSAEASFRCYAQLFRKFDIVFDREAFERTYSPDWYRTYEGVGLPDERWSEADAMWLSLYAREKCELVSGAAEALRSLSRAGLASGIVTSGSRGRVLPEIHTLGLGDLFQALVFCEDCARKKPDPEALLFALDRLRVVPAEAVYVGDSPEDVLMARAAGVRSVGIAGGFPNRAARAAAAPDLTADSLREAVDAVLRLAQVGLGSAGRAAQGALPDPAE
jgi:HAD superfamily hydrolase (TIGR01509 family)